LTETTLYPNQIKRNPNEIDFYFYYYGHPYGVVVMANFAL